MEDIALAALPRDVESDTESEASPESTGSSGSRRSSLSRLSPVRGLPPFAEFVAGIGSPTDTPHLEDVERSNMSLLPEVVKDLLPGYRSKVYELRKNDWFDVGTGHCACTTAIRGESRIVVLAEEGPTQSLINVRPTRSDGFQRLQDTLLVWTGLNCIDMALSFQEPDDCTKVWEYIARSCLQLESDNIIKPGPKDDISRTASSHWSILERAEFRGHVEHYGTDWAAIANVMGTKTMTMLKNDYFQLLSDGDTDLQRIAVESDRKRHETAMEKVYASYEHPLLIVFGLTPEFFDRLNKHHGKLPKERKISKSSIHAPVESARPRKDSKPISVKNANALIPGLCI
jgi:hypothetical protein